VKGKKTWMVARWLDGKFIKKKIGYFPALRVKAAREVAHKPLEAFDRGENPHELEQVEKKKRQAIAAQTVAVVVEKWLDDDQKENRTFQEVSNFFMNRLIPYWKDRPITTICKKDCNEFIDKIAKESSDHHSRKAFAYLHRFLKWCTIKDILVNHPMVGMEKRGHESKRDRFLSRLEIKLFWEATEKMGYPFGPCLQLLLLTGCRREEIAGLRLDEIKENRIELPGKRVKRLPENAEKGRTVPLSSKAWKILEAVKNNQNVSKSELVFTTGRSRKANGINYRPISGWGRAKETLDSFMQAGLPSSLKEWRIHDLRRTVASHLQKLGSHPLTIETLLGHLSTGGSRSGIIGRYQCADFGPETVEAVEKWSAEVDKIIAGDIKEKVLSMFEMKAS
jgi:integrase